MKTKGHRKIKKSLEEDPNIRSMLSETFSRGTLSLAWASLVAQMVMNLLALWEIPVQSLGQEDPLEKGMTIHFSTLTWRIPWTVHGITESEKTEQLILSLSSSVTYNLCTSKAS